MPAVATAPAPADAAQDVRLIKISEICLDEGQQGRVETNPETIEEYADSMKSGVIFPPIVIFTDEASYWPSDGIHRINAAIKAGLKEIKAVVRQGTKHDAAVAACGANKDHGLKRTNADKRAAVERLLKLEPEWASNRIAEHVGVDHKFVGSVRDQLATDPSCEVDVNPATRVGKDGKRRAAKKRTKASPPKPAAPKEESEEKVVVEKEPVEKEVEAEGVEAEAEEVAIIEKGSNDDIAPQNDTSLGEVPESNSEDSCKDRQTLVMKTLGALERAVKSAGIYDKCSDHILELRRRIASAKF